MFIGAIAALQSIARDKEVSETLFEILETQQITEGGADITVLPAHSRNDLLAQLTATPPTTVVIPKK